MRIPASLFLLSLCVSAAEPRLFAPGAVSSRAFELTPAFTPDGNTCYFVRYAAGMKYPTIVESRFVDGAWTAARPVPFSGAYRDAPPALSPDGTKLYFASQRQLPGKAGPPRQWHIWWTARTATGWAEPQPVGAPVLDEAKSQSSPSVTANGTLYYTSPDPGAGWEIWRARPGSAPEKVPHVNTRFDESWAYISPDESLLLYSSQVRFDGLGESDLYFARNFDKGRREVEIRAFPEPINSAAEENCPRLSPDGKRLLFTRNGDVYEADLVAAAPADPAWTDATPMLNPRIWSQAVVLNGRIYVYGGLGEKHGWVNVVEEYDSASRQWRKRADPPEGWSKASLSTVNGKLYLLRRDGDGVAEYEPASDQWRVLAAASGPVIHDHDRPFRIRTAVAGGRLFTLTNETAGTGGDDCSSFAEFDAARLQWVERASMPVPAIQLASVGGRVFAFGGGHRAESVSEYDPATDRWTPRRPMRTGRYEAALAVLNGKVYFIGGHRMFTGDLIDTVEEYDPATDRWNPSPRHRREVWGATAAVLDGKIYVMGGSDLTGRPMNTVVVFRPVQR